MRIIKLGKGEFKNRDEVENYFQSVLYERNPEGKFWLPTKKMIDKDEFLMFSYEKIVRFTAIAKTGLLENNDDRADDYPYCFVIDMSSLQSANISLEQVEDELKDVYGKSIASVQTWSKIPDSSKAIELWESLRKK
jgi:hypothetical protein